VASYSSTSFSTDAFSELAFDFGSTPTEETTGRSTYVLPYHKYREEEYQRSVIERKAELERVEQELALAEERKREEEIALAKRQLDEAVYAAELAALEARLQDEINRLRMERVWLMRLIDDEEAILVLLLSGPLH
jgi:hypothetical protein